MIDITQLDFKLDRGTLEYEFSDSCRVYIGTTYDETYDYRQHKYTRIKSTIFTFLYKPEKLNQYAKVSSKLSIMLVFNHSTGLTDHRFDLDKFGSVVYNSETFIVEAKRRIKTRITNVMKFSWLAKANKVLEDTMEEFDTANLILLDFIEQIKAGSKINVDLTQ